MIEAAKGFRKLKANKQLPALREALDAHKLSLQRSHSQKQGNVPRRSSTSDGTSPEAKSV
jgi:hypothetical protein